MSSYNWVTVGNFDPNKLLLIKDFLFSPRTLGGSSRTVLFGQMVFKLFSFSREQVIQRINAEVHFPSQRIYFCGHWVTVLLSVDSGSVVLLLVQTDSKVYGRPEAVWGLSVAAGRLRQSSSVKKRHCRERLFKGAAMKGCNESPSDIITLGIIISYSEFYTIFILKKH